jgi:hypothetical protein
MSPRLCTYIVTEDTGLAPNPFWGWCTLAVCTPNHQNDDLHEGDWIAGFLGAKRKHSFLYAMEIIEVLRMDKYYIDPRFEKKKPNLRGDWKERCGDNFYEQEPDGTWTQHRNRFHLGPNYLERDTRFPKVFVAKRFWYLGRSCKQAPAKYAKLFGGRGIRCEHDAALVADFRKWVDSSFDIGIHENPNDNPDM